MSPQESRKEWGHWTRRAKEVIRLLRSAKSVGDVAEKLGAGRRQIYRIAASRQHPEVGAALRRAQARWLQARKGNPKMCDSCGVRFFGSRCGACSKGDAESG